MFGGWRRSYRKFADKEPKVDTFKCQGVELRQQRGQAPVEQITNTGYLCRESNCARN